MSKSINIGDNWDHLKDGIHYDEIKRLTDRLKANVKELVEDYLHNTGIGCGLEKIHLEYDIEFKRFELDIAPKDPNVTKI